MGNEMGNNNTSGLREGDNTIIEDQGKSAQEPVRDIDAKAQTHVVLLAGSIGYREKGAGLAADDPNGAPDDKTSSGTEMKSNEAGGEDTEIQSASLSNELESHEKQTDSNLAENLLEASHSQLEKQASLKKEEEEVLISVRKSPSHDPEPQDSTASKFDQLEIAKDHAGQSLKRMTYSIRGTESTQGSSVICTSEENGYQGHEFETNIANSLDETVVSETNLDVENKKDVLLVEEMTSQQHKMPGKEKFEVEENDGNGLNATASSDFPNDIGQKCDGELTSEMSCYGNKTLEPQKEANLMAKSLSSHLEASLPEDKIMVLTEGNELKKKESESEDGKLDYTANEWSKDSIGEALDEANASQTDSFIRPNFGNKENQSSVCVSDDPDKNGDCQFESKIDKHRHSIDLSNNNQSEAGKEHCNQSEELSKMVLELGMLTAELTMSDGKSNEEKPEDFNHLKEEPEEKQMVEGLREKTGDLCTTGKGAEERENGEQVMFRSLPVQEYYNSRNSASQTLYQQNFVEESEDAQGSSEPNLQLKAENCVFFLTAASTFRATNLIEKTLVSPVELALEKHPPEASHYVTVAAEFVTETKSSAPAHQNSEQCEEVEASFFASGGYEVQGSVGRLSSESIPNDLNIQVEMRKSPSFDFGLRMEARSEESDRAPLLYQDKTTIEILSNQADVTRQNPPLRDRCHQEALHWESMPVEEKVITLERIDSEKSRTPFLGSPKEDDALVVVKSKEQDNYASSSKANKDVWNSPTKEVASPLPKGKQKQKRRMSLFSNCICCATLIN